MSQKLKCLVIDDDPMICDLVKHFCSKLEKIEYCITANSGHDGLQLLSNQKFDLLLLDYHLPDMTGHALMEINSQKVPIIMITSEKEFASTAYDYEEIIDFLVKPLNFDRFSKAIERLNKRTSGDHSVVQASDDICYIKDGSRYTKLKYSEILFLKAEENYVAFTTADKTILSLSTLKDVEAKLPSHFMKVHRSYIVNLNKIDTATLEEIKIMQHTIPVSQKYKKELFTFLSSN